MKELNNKGYILQEAASGDLPGNAKENSNRNGRQIIDAGPEKAGVLSKLTGALDGTGTIGMSLVWFGSAVSLAEILTGTELAGLGMRSGLTAILLGHLVGCILLILAGLIGVKTRQGSMASTAVSFGKYGSKFFAALNVLQLVGWQGIMIYDAAISANRIAGIGLVLWSVLIGVLTVFWIVNGAKTRGALNAVTMTALLVLTVLLCRVIFTGSAVSSAGESTALADTAVASISFGAGLELAIAMPLSWLPMIADYTSKAKKPVRATFASCITYSVISSWMYIIGLGAAILTQESSVDQIMLKAGLGIAGLIIIVFSCVTTNFIDAYSCNASTFALFANSKREDTTVAEATSNAENAAVVVEAGVEEAGNPSGKKSFAKKLLSNLKENWPGIIDTIVGTVGACLFAMDNIAGFLYLIGSVFAPMFAIQLADVFILKIADQKTGSELGRAGKKWDAVASISWIIGFVLYRILMNYSLPVGNTLPDMAITMLVVVVLRLLTRKLVKKENA